MQRLSPQELQSASEVVEEMLPALEGAEHYFALVRHNGKVILGICGQDERWRPTTYQEMMQMM